MKNFCLNLSYFESVEQYEKELILIKSDVKKRIKNINKKKFNKKVYNGINELAIPGIALGTVITTISKVKYANGDFSQPCNLYLGLTIGLIGLTALLNMGYNYLFLRDEELEGNKAELKEINKQLRLIKKVTNH